MVVMETMSYACIPSFISMSATVSKFEEGISNFKEKCLRLFVVVQVVMETMLCAYVYQVEKV